MKFAQTHKIFTYFLAIVSAIPLLVSGEIGVVWRFIFPLLALAGWFLESPLTTNRKYRRFITLAVFLLLTVQSGRFLGGAPMAMMGMEFAIGLLGLKLLSRGHASDYQQIVILAFLQVIAGTVTMDDLLFAGVFLAVVTLSPPVLALSYLRKEMEQRFGESHHRRKGEMLERLLRSKRVISPGFILGSSALSLPVLVITTVLFVLFPRIGFGLFGHLKEKSETVGFGDNVKLGDLDILQQDQTVLIRLQPFGFQTPPPTSLSLRLRGAIFDQYRDSTWTKSRKEDWRRLIATGSDYPLEKKFVVKTTTPGYEVLLETMRPSLLFIPEGTGVVTTYRTAEGGQPRTRQLTSNQYGTIYYRDSARVGLRYKVYLTGAPPFGDPPAGEHGYLQLPENHQRIKALATELAGQGTPLEQARRLSQNLKHNYKYSLKLSSSEANALADTPLDRFLFTRRTGTCEHFSSALTLMLRAIGIPSRMATGFSGADWNPVGGYYAVPNRYAHAWTEAFLDGQWRTLDATPASTTTEGNWRMNQLALLLDALKMRWHKHVVGYDAASQFEIAMGLRSLWIKSFRTKRNGEGNTWKWVVIGMVGAALAGMLSLRLWRRRKRPQIKSEKRTIRTRRMREATRLYLSLEKRLARRGYVRPRNRTPIEHWQILNQSNVPFAYVVKEIVEGYNRLRFGPQAQASGPQTAGDGPQTPGLGPQTPSWETASTEDFRRLWSLIREI